MIHPVMKTDTLFQSTSFSFWFPGTAGHAGEWNFAQTGKDCFVIQILVSFFSLKSLTYIMECTVYSLHFEDWGASRFLSINWSSSPNLSWILCDRKEESSHRQWRHKPSCSPLYLLHWESRFRHNFAFRVCCFSCIIHPISSIWLATCGCLLFPFRLGDFVYRFFFLVNPQLHYLVLLIWNLTPDHSVLMNWHTGFCC